MMRKLYRRIFIINIIAVLIFFLLIAKKADILRTDFGKKNEYKKHFSKDAQDSNSLNPNEAAWKIPKRIAPENAIETPPMKTTLVSKFNHTKTLLNTKPLKKTPKTLGLQKTVKPVVTSISPTHSVSSQLKQSHKKYLIYYCSGGIGHSFCSGLGNRQIGIVASYLLANATGRHFGVVMTHPCNIENFLVPNQHDWKINSTEIANLTTIKLLVRNSRKFTNSLGSINFNEKYPQDVVYIQNNHEYQNQLWQNKLFRKNLRWLKGLPKNKIYQKVLNLLFKLHPNVQKKKDAFFKLARPTPGSKLACAQVRMGKNPTIPWDNRPMNTMKGVEELWNFFEMRDNKSKIFVTSDSKTVITSGRKRFPKRFITSDGPIIHIDKPYRGSICDGMEKLVLDQMILVDCDTLVISGSSFGRIPAYVRSRPGVFLFNGGKVSRW